MTADDFRRLALSFPEAVENSHMGHPDFRVHGKIFAALQYPDESWGMVKLTQKTSKLSCMLNLTPSCPSKAPGDAKAVRVSAWRLRMQASLLRHSESLGAMLGAERPKKQPQKGTSIRRPRRTR